MTNHQELAIDINIVLDFVERWNKNDEEGPVAYAAEHLKRFLNERASREEKHVIVDWPEGVGATIKPISYAHKHDNGLIVDGVACSECFKPTPSKAECLCGNPSRKTYSGGRHSSSACGPFPPPTPSKALVLPPLEELDILRYGEDYSGYETMLRLRDAHNSLVRYVKELDKKLL